MTLNPRQKTNYSEKVHIRYLTKYLNVERFGHKGNGYDLVSEPHFFELKTKLCLFNKSGPTKNIWWPLSQPQIGGYEKANTPKLWMFVHAFTRKPSSQLTTKRQLRESIYHRDVFVAPWEIYKQSPLGNEGKNAKGVGPYRHVSRKNLMKWVQFYRHQIHQGTLYLPVGHNLEYLIKQ